LHHPNLQPANSTIPAFNHALSTKMTQARSGQSLRLQLTPMQLSEAAPTERSALMVSMATDTSTRGCTMLLHPGEPSEMVVQIDNLGTRTLQLNLQVEGDFPAQWCRIGMEGHAL